MQEKLTVLIPTSPISSHPSTAIIEETVSTVRHHLPDCRILIMADGVREEQQSYAEQYAQYKGHIYDLTCGPWHNVDLVILDDFMHQANMTKALLANVDTPLLLFIEHDTPLVTDYDIEWQGLTKTVLSGEANMIRLHHEALILDEHKEFMLDYYPEIINGVPLIRTLQWSQRPHIASVAFYRELLDEVVTADSRTMIEDAVHRVITRAMWINRRECWEKYRLMVYAPSGNMKRSYTLDGRQSDPKYEMIF